MITTGAGLLIRENSWAHRLFPPCICIFLANTYCGIRNNGVRRANHHATSPRPRYTRKYRARSTSSRIYFAARWKTPGIRPINLRSWNWFAGFNHRELFLSQGWRFPSLASPRLVSSRLVSSRLVSRLLPFPYHPLRILGIFLAPLWIRRCRRSFTEGIFTSRCNRRFERFFRETVDRAGF